MERKQALGKMVFSLRDRLGRRVAELDELPLKELLHEPT